MLKKETDREDLLEQQPNKELIYTFEQTDITEDGETLLNEYTFVLPNDQTK